MTDLDRTSHLNTLAETPALLKAALKGVPKKVLLWTPGPGKWSMLEIVAHMRDMERDAITKVEEKILDLELKIKAVDHLDDIVKCLKSKMNDKEMTEKLSKAMKVSLEDAFKVICFEVRRLKALEKSELLNKIKELKVEIKSYEVRIKKPDEYILTTLKDFEKL